MRTALLTLLKTVSAVSNRVYANHAPQKCASPYLVYLTVSALRDYTHDGFSGLTTTHIQVSCYATGYADADAVAAQVISALEGWAGTDPVQAVFCRNRQDFWEEDVGLHHVALDFEIWHGEVEPEDDGEGDGEGEPEPE